MIINKHLLKYSSLVLTVGIMATIGQLIFLRLVAQSFYGNEITMCIAIGHWLLWTGIGSLAGSTYLRNVDKSPRLLPLMIFYSLFLVLCSYSLLLIRRIFGIELSEMIGLGRIFLWTGMLFMIPSFLNGLFFPFLVRWVTDRKSQFPVHHVYIGEVIGSAMGGILFILLIRSGSNTLVLLHLTIGFYMIVAAMVILQKAVYKVLLLTGVVIIEFLLFQFVTPEAVIKKWYPYRLRDYRESPHQAISEAFYGGGITLFGNNEPIWNIGIIEDAEEKVHFGMLNHQAPQKALIIGVANADIYRQIQKYSTLKSITVVQTDAVLQKMIDAHSLQQADSMRVEVHIDDPLKFLKKTDQQFDVVLINIPLPVNAMWNRFYTVEFFRLLKRQMDNTAIVSMQFPGGETYLSDEHVAFLKIMENTVRNVFDQSCWIPGETVHLLASESPLNNRLDYFTGQLKNRDISNLYIQESYLWDRLSPQKIAFLENHLLANNNRQINTLQKPVGFYYDTLLWDQQTKGVLKSVYQYLDKTKPVYPGLFVIGLILIVIIRFRVKKRPASILKLNMAVIGFSIMSLESIVIIVYQSYVGALYLNIALLTTAFMAGAAMGAWRQRRSVQHIRFKQFLRLAVGLTIIIIVYAVLLLSQSVLLTFSIVHYVMLWLGGLVSGTIFPMLSYLVQKHESTKLPSASGSIYACDIIGSCLGIYLTSGIIIPVFGLSTAAVGLIGLLAVIITGNRWIFKQAD
ncbi:MAG: hypothetical protein ISS29_02670 [Candidatus Marinimicrobia bacterium]|nr:hypothetical protein [Candidatus Neomarinimicrobiota bacterium]